MQESVAIILRHCDDLAARDALHLADLVVVAERVALSGAQIDALALPDGGRPYGRRVLLATPRLEVMVATWTPNVPCAPHDHGGSLGVVRVLRGTARHQIWGVQAGALQLYREHGATAGDVLACGPDFVHSMTSVDAQEPLVTLHIYTDAIPYMIVYDEAAGDTLIVDGGCGAWVPHDQPALLLARYPGLLDRGTVSARWAGRSGSAPAAG